MRGKVLSGRYELVEKLGSGGMGTVWRARDRDLGREVAVKIFSPPEDIADEERTELLGRFRREARAAAALDSPHIATIHDHGADGGVPYLVMELIEGRSLEQVLRDEGRVPVGQALGWAAQICRALDTAHEAGVVHRDIKPANVIVSPDDTAVVLDFGIAKFQEAVEAESKLTRTGHMPLGSVLYMAPERFRMEAGDGREDLYALGCVLYELLIGRPPFVGPAAGVMYNHLHDTPLRPSRARAELTVHIDQLILDLMAKSADDRPADAAEAATRLAALREETAPEPETEPEPEQEPEPDPEPEPAGESAPEPAAAPKPTPKPTPRPAPTPKPTPAPVRRPAPAPSPASEPEPARRSSPGKLAAGIGLALAAVAGIGVVVGLDRPSKTGDPTGTGPRDPQPGATAASGNPGTPGTETHVPDQYTIVYTSPTATGDDSAAPVKKAVEEAGDELELDVKVDTADSDATDLNLQQSSDVVAVIGDTGSDYGFPDKDAAPPVTVDTCGEPGEELGRGASAGHAFGLQPSPARVAARLATYLRQAHGVRAPLIADDGKRGEFTEQLGASVSKDDGNASEFEGAAEHEDGKYLTAEADRKRSDAVLLPYLASSGRFAPQHLLGSDFAGPVLAPSSESHGCESGSGGEQAEGAGEADGALKGVRRYRTGPTGARAARSREHDAALAVVTALARQRGTPTVERARGDLAEDLKKIRAEGDLGPVAFEANGYAKDRPLWIDRSDGTRWREERKLTPP